VGFLLNTWLGLLIGIVVYIGSRLYSPEEEHMLAKIFGERWVAYSGNVKLKWL
jgi:protein-S-isoprenylcysteine O-methyltransferase Ste14